MALQITDENTERAVRALAAATGESIDEAVGKAAEARLLLVRPVVRDGAGSFAPARDRCVPYR